MPSLFISYRREDTVAYAGRLYDHLGNHFGADKVFMDIGQIAPGEDFVEVLEARIRSSEVVIALIGPAWLSVSNGQGPPARPGGRFCTLRTCCRASARQAPDSGAGGWREDA
jgi:hypothetical protein